MVNIRSISGIFLKIRMHAGNQTVYWQISGGYPSSRYQGPKPVFRRADIRRISGGYPADIRPPEESSGWIFRDVTDESGRISLPIGRNREESGDGRSGRTGPRPPPLSSLFKPMGREMRPRRHGKSIRRTPPEGGYPPSGNRVL